MEKHGKQPPSSKGQITRFMKAERGEPMRCHSSCGKNIRKKYNYSKKSPTFARINAKP
jgi:hypothetical protein